jgi:hypothetical protein
MRSSRRRAASAGLAWSHHSGGQRRSTARILAAVASIAAGLTCTCAQSGCTLPDELPSGSEKDGRSWSTAFVPGAPAYCVPGGEMEAVTKLDDGVCNIQCAPGSLRNPMQADDYTYSCLVPHGGTDGELLGPDESVRCLRAHKPAHCARLSHLFATRAEPLRALYQRHQQLAPDALLLRIIAACPLGSTTNEPHMDSISDCSCMEGFSGDAPSWEGFCTPCASGTFRGASDPPEACIPCPSGSTTEEGATAIDQCSCQAGYNDDEGACSPCPVATYKPDNGPGACSACPAGSTTTQTGTTAITDCLCPEGAFLSGEICAPCPIGTFKTEVGSEECTTCPEGKQSATPSCYLPACLLLPHRSSLSLRLIFVCFYLRSQRRPLQTSDQTCAPNACVILASSDRLLAL